MATAPLGTLLRQVHRLAAGPGACSQPDQQLLDDFLARHDQAAFAALVGRHGPMVLRVCHRVLHHEQDAEDAFQATFLVLARSSGMIRRPQALAGWLHAVAYRITMKAKRSAARRRNHEAQLRDRRTDLKSVPPSWDDVQTILDEEIERLPDPYRSAFVLCVLEGKSWREAAAVLGVKGGTILSRVSRARQLLQHCLTRRGIKLATLLAALSLAESSARSALPSALGQTTVQFGLLVAAGESAAGLIPTHIAALAAGVTRAMFLTKAKLAIAALLVTGLISAACRLAWSSTAGEQKPAAANRNVDPSDGNRQAAKETGKPKDGVEISGRVLGPDGKPVVGARLFVYDRAGKSAAPQPLTDGGGRFRFAVAADVAANPRYLLATAAGLGLDWTDLRLSKAGHELTLHLPADEPIRGRVVDLEGKPIAGAAVRIVELTTSESGSLDEFLKQWAADKEKSPTGRTFHLLTEKSLWLPMALNRLPTATTGRDGIFRMSHVGRDRGLMLGVRAPGMADHYVRVVTRADFPAPRTNQGQVALSGPKPTVVLAPGKPIRGTLRDAKTKKPLAGIRVLAYTPDRPIDWWWQRVETVTDAQGHYQLDGLAKSSRHILAFDPGAGAPHMHRFAEVSDTPGFVPIVHDTELHRGVVVSGQVTNRSTGRPVRARVVYCPLMNNQHYNSTPGYAVPRTQLVLWVDSREMHTGPDGRYRLTALPGPGALFVQADASEGPFTPPSVAKEDRDPAVFEPCGEIFLTLGMGDIFPMSHLHAYRLLRSAEGATTLIADFALDPGARRRGRVLDSDGRPLTGAEAMSLTPVRGEKAVLPGAEFTAEALNPAKPRRLLFWHTARKLAGTIVLRGDELEPVTVTLQSLGSLTGRALRTNGEPLVGYSVEYSAWPEVELPDRQKRPERAPILTDREGRFRVTNLPAGVPLNLSVIVPKSRYAVIYRDKIVLKPGKTSALGDLRGDPDEP
jgi:RNA polymerase sigma factor (sigma-70 family)